jgi:hypothetical protein
MLTAFLVSSHPGLLAFCFGFLFVNRPQNMFPLNAVFWSVFRLLLACWLALDWACCLVLGDCTAQGHKLTCADPVGNLTGAVEVGISLLNHAAARWTPTVQLLRIWLPDLKVSSPIFPISNLHFFQY